MQKEKKSGFACKNGKFERRAGSSFGAVQEVLDLGHDAAGVVAMGEERGVRGVGKGDVA